MGRAAIEFRYEKLTWPGGARRHQQPPAPCCLNGSRARHVSMENQVAAPHARGLNHRPVLRFAQRMSLSPRSRRELGRLLASVVLLAFVSNLPLAARAVAEDRRLFFVGSYTGAKSKGIYSFRFDADAGTVESLGVAAQSINPSFL